MKILLINTLLLFLFLNCSKKMEPVVSTESNAPAAPKVNQQLADNDGFADKKEMAEEEAPAQEKRKDSKGGMKEDDGIIQKPLDPISEASKSRLLEYTIQLNYKVETIEKARETVLNVVKKESYIASSQTNVSSGYESMSLQVQVPVTAMYDTLLQLDKIGQLTYEDIRTQDWTEHNELQKNKLSREALRMIRRSKAANKGSAETWNWKDREEALERSEDTADAAKLESWKIKDHVAWAKVNISISGRELPTKVQVPNYKDALISALNFLLELTYYLVWIVPIAFVGYLLFKGYRWIRR
ncbi:MAG TPA: DUF4349 domain-containing protein [Leptospiraceae bacterium]|nr:DUF4349 domain-containing protein [Leptospiraceae bacterium]